MENRTRKLVQQVLAAVLCADVALAQSGAASGSISINGEQIALRHAYASAQRGFFDNKSEDIRILLTDVPVAEADRDDTFRLARLARDGRLHAVEVILSARGEPLSGSLFLSGFNGMASASGMHRFESEALERTRVAGRMFTDGPRTFGGVTYQYDTKFSAPIPRPATPEETATALASPAARAAAAHLAAIRSGFAAFVATLTTESAASFRLPGGGERFAELRAETPDDSRVVSITTTGEDRRVATIQGNRKGIVIESTVKVRRIGETWKIDR